MTKNIKKSLKYFIIFLGIIITLPALLYPILRIPEVQTLILRRITNHLSGELQSTISVGRMEYVFFNKLNLYDILIKDRDDDTLIYSQKLSAGFRKIDFRNKTFTFGRVTALNPVVGLITDSTGLMNLKWYLEKLISPNDTLKKNAGKVKINQIDLSNARFKLINKAAKRGNTPLDFTDLQLTEVNGIIENFYTRHDTTSLTIYNLSFSERGGLNVKKLGGDLLLAKNNITLTSLFLNLDTSILNIPHISFKGDSSASFSNFAEDIRMDISFDRSLISFSDLQYFIKVPPGINESVWLSGKVSGTLSELRGRNINLKYRDYTTIECDFDISGLPQIENSFIYLGISDLKTNAIDLEKINTGEKKNLLLPEFLHKMGTTSFNGSFTGFTTDFVAYGRLGSDQGTISVDISVRPEKQNSFKVNGLITGSSIALGYLTGNDEMFGNITMRTNVDGYASSFKKFSGSLTGNIDTVEINHYKYRNIALKGTFSEKTWDGSINISEKNIRMDLLGMFNFNRDLPEFDFTLNLPNANLNKLHFDKNDTTSSLSLLLTANFRGSNFDNINGEIKLLNSNIRKHGNLLELYNLSVKTFTENNKPAINLRTDFLDADLRGNYNFSDLATELRRNLAELMPSRFTAPVNKLNSVKNNFNFIVNFKNTDKINNFFQTGLLLSDKSKLTGIIFPDSLIIINGDAKTLTFKNNIFRDFALDANMTSGKLSLEIKSSALNILGQSELKSFTTDLVTFPDNFIFTVDWDNREKELNKGNFIAKGAFIRKDEKNSGPVLQVTIDSTDVYTRNNLWKISHSVVDLDTSSVKINKLFIASKERYYLIDGTVSEDPSDTLKLEFRGIDLSPLNYLAKNKNDPEAIPLGIKGELNGNILLTDLYKNPLFESNLKVTSFSILNAEYGLLSVSSVWNSDKKVAEINASSNLKGKKMLNISGYYDPQQKRIDLNALADKLPVDALNPLLKIFASGINGTASGKANLSGGPGNLALKGSIMAENTTMKVDYLQTKYTINDSIRFDRNNIIFKNVKLTDEKGNNAFLDGSVRHKSFKDFAADLKINTNQALVLNTKPKDNELFYGTAYATGLATIKSGPASLSFDISARTGRNTKFYIPLNTSETISDYSFIKFIDKDSSSGEGEKNLLKIPNPPAQTGMDLNFDLEVTPDAEIQLIFDSKLGDVMKGTGSGNLNINLSKTGEFKISGDYLIENGDYLFTLGNILNKPFSVENGGKITFNGDIDNAEIDVKAIYKLKASLYEILQDERFNERIPVECQINLTGKLFNPLIAFNIYLPLADEETRTYLKNVITSEEELSRQFLYLLVMNSFYADPASGSSIASASSAGPSAMAVTTTEMLSNQLSNWLSQISNDFDIGFVYRPGYKDINSQEVQVALSTQLLNDKVVINGNFDVRGPGGTSANTDQITGDFDVEYKITEKIRFKVFNRFNNPYSGKQADYTQGFGLFYKQDFDKFSDLFRKKEKPEIKKEEETEIDVK